MPARDSSTSDPVSYLCRCLHRDLRWPLDKVLMLELRLRDEYGGRRFDVRAPAER